MTLICVLSVLVALFLIGKRKTYWDINPTRITRIQEKYIAVDKKMVGKLRKFYNQQNLKSVEQDFEDEIKRLQSWKELISVISPLLALFIVVFNIYYFGLPVQSVGTNFLYGTVPGLSGLVALVLAGINFYREFLLQPDIADCNKCISVLKKAQIRTDNSEENQINPSGKNQKKPSLMSKVKTIKINAPEDFAANIDLYLSGEKRIEQDIR